MYDLPASSIISQAFVRFRDNRNSFTRVATANQHSKSIAYVSISYEDAFLQQKDVMCTDFTLTFSPIAVISIQNRYDTISFKLKI